MRFVSLSIVVLTALLSNAGLSADGQSGPDQAAWRPVPWVLQTRWAKDVSPEKVHPEYPRPQMVRTQWQNLNGLWDYAIAPAAEGAPKKYEGKILVPFPIEAPLSGVRKSPNGRIWYRRTFESPAGLVGKRLLLHFQAADWETTAYVNGREVGTHRGGYDAFTFDITDALKPGAAQEIVVAVLDTTSNQAKGKQMGGWLQGTGTLGYGPSSGIWQTVWLEPAPAAGIAGLKMTPDIDANVLRLVVSGQAATGAKTGAETVEAVASDAGQEVARATGKLGAEIALAIPHAKLWSPDSPHLYDLKVILKKDGGPIDAVESYFGMRKISVGKDPNGHVRIYLNGKYSFQIGPLDQGYWPDGMYTAPTDEALRYDIEVMKQLGCNAVRKHVKIEPDRWYYWCDKLGLMVWQDMPSGAGKKTPEIARQFETELQAMIDGRYNHPSIIMWILFNERWGEYDSERLAAWMKRYDPSRLISPASDAEVAPLGDIHDSHLYWLPEARGADGRRALVTGEFGGRALVVPGHVVTEKVFGHPGGTVLQSPWEWERHYAKLMRVMYEQCEPQGLCGAMYTQLTDIEAECNGWLTYDRAVVKIPPERIAALHRGQLGPPPKFKMLSPTAQQKRKVLWRYTHSKPADDWFQPGFNDAAWPAGPGGFGRLKVNQAAIGTEWNAGDLWMRREFILTEQPQAAQFFMSHDALTEIYINGVLACVAPGYTVDYEEFEMRPQARATLKVGNNVIAVHCPKNPNGPGIDVGVVEPEPLAPGRIYSSRRDGSY
jgi:hypothetical protein